MNLKVSGILAILLLIGASIPLTSNSLSQTDNDIINCCSLDDITRVSIQPSTQTVEKDEWFNVGIYVEPSELIMGVAVDICFDPTIIQANSVFVGDLFDWPPVPGHPPGFYPGDIDNINGKITDIMGFVSIFDAVSDPGYFCDITFIAQQKLGTSYIILEEVIVASTNGTSLPLEVNNGEVIIGGNTPEISDVVLTASEPLDTDFPFGWENFSAIVIDDYGGGVDEVKLVVTYPIEEEYPMTNIPGTDEYYYNTTLTIEGCYEYHVWAVNFNDNYAESPSQQFELPPNEDVDMNGCIHFMDMVAIVLVYGDCGPPGWIREDVNNDGCVNFMDLVAIVLRYGECWEQC